MPEACRALEGFSNRRGATPTDASRAGPWCRSLHVPFSGGRTPPGAARLRWPRRLLFLNVDVNFSRVAAAVTGEQEKIFDARVFCEQRGGLLLQTVAHFDEALGSGDLPEEWLSTTRAGVQARGLAGWAVERSGGESSR